MTENGRKGTKGMLNANPFKKLKGMAVSPPVPIRAIVPDHAIVAEEDDEALFIKAMQGVNKMGGRGKSVPPPATPSGGEAPAVEDEQVFQVALEALHMDVVFKDNVPEDEDIRPRPVNRMRQLRRGRIRIDYELDLHGLTRDEALKSLPLFINGAHRRGQKAVLVITGKGNNSDGEPVLLKAVTDWLKQQCGTTVSEFSIAPRDLGGGGAIVVFLKER